MAIVRLINTREPGSFRAFQQRLTTVGKIRLGVYNGRYPEKIDTFRFTSPDEQLVRAAADAYGGTAEAWTPNGSKTPQWEVISEAKALPVYLVHGQSLEPWYEAWAGGRTCVRRCDGVTNKITDEACVCIPADGSASKLPQKELCKPTIRVQVMLQEIPGLGSWMMESHGENAVQEISTLAPLVAGAAMPIPAVLRLREESRREWNPDKRKFDSKSFYVPWFDISVVTSRQVALGGDALNVALAGAGAPVALSGDRRMAIDAAPAAPAGLDPVRRGKILADIEAQTTVEGLNAIGAKLKQLGIVDPQVKEAAVSKRAAIMAAEQYAQTTLSTQPGDEGYESILAVEAYGDEPEWMPPGVEGDMFAAPVAYRVLVTGSRTWDDADTIRAALEDARRRAGDRPMVVVHGACPSGADKIADDWATTMGGITTEPERYPADWDRLGKSAGFQRNRIMVDTRPDEVLSFNRCNSVGTKHCTDAAEAAGLNVTRFTDDRPVERKAPDRIPKGIANVVRVDGMPKGIANVAQDTPDDDMPRVLPFPSEDEMNLVQAAGEPCCGGYRTPDEMWSPCTPCPVTTLRGRTFASMAEAEVAAVHEASPVRRIAETLEGTVEGEASALPMIPDGNYDADDVYASIMNGASKQTPPLTTGQVNALILRTFPGTAGVEFVSGYELARLREGLKSGAVSWR